MHGQPTTALKCQFHQAPETEEQRVPLCPGCLSTVKRRVPLCSATRCSTLPHQYYVKHKLKMEDYFMSNDIIK
jgi:hypothetical protein